MKNREMAMAPRGPFFALHLPSPNRSRPTPQPDVSPARRADARALVLWDLHKIRTTGGVRRRLLVDEQGLLVDVRRRLLVNGEADLG